MKPLVIYDLKILESNIIKMKKELKNISFLFPVKCCNNKKVLKIIEKNDFGYDISNLNEYKLIKKYLKNQFVSATGPLSYELDGVKYKNIHIVSNVINTFKEGNGIRINFNSNSKFNQSRFGFDYKKMDKSFFDKIKYVHFHNSDHKDSKKCDLIYKEIEKIVSCFPNLAILNIGGHLEDLTFDEGIKYLNRVRKIVPKKISVYVEVGDFLFKNVGKLYCNVIDVRNNDNIQYITLNFSKMANQRWAYPVLDTVDYDKDTIYTVFGGCSCCETDTYLETNANILKQGDKLVFSNISPYSYQWNTSFNGIKKIKCIFK